MIGMPYILTGLAAVGFGSGWWVHGLHYDSMELARERGQKEALTTAAQEVIKLNPKEVTINRGLKEVVREVPIYRDCNVDPLGMRLLRQAYGSEPSGDDQLPSPSAAVGSQYGITAAGRSRLGDAVPQVSSGTWANGE